MSFAWRRQFLIASCIALASFVGATDCAESANSASSAKIDAWDIKQQTDQLGPVEVIVSAVGIKFITEKGGFTVFSKSPDWKCLGYNQTEHTGFLIPIDEWPNNGLKMFKTQGNFLAGTKSNYYDPNLKMTLLQSQSSVGGRYYGSEDPAIFRSAKKKTLTAVRLRVAPQIKLDDMQKKVVQGIYSVPSNGGFPIEVCNMTTDGASGSTYSTKWIKRTKVDPAIFNYPTDYKIAKQKIDVYLTHTQRQSFADFLDVFSDNSTTTAKKSK